MKGPGFVLFVFVLVHVVQNPLHDTAEVYDFLQDFSSHLNKEYGLDTDSTKVLIFATSVIIQIAGYGVVFLGLFGDTFRPLTGALMATLARQLCCYMMELPVPNGIQWFKPYPAVPEIVFYDVQNDLYYSGHVGLVTTMICEMLYRGKRSIALFFVGSLLWEIYVLIVLRVHYTIDVIDGTLSVFIFMILANRWRVCVDAFIDGFAARLGAVFFFFKWGDSILPKKLVRINFSTLFVRFMLLMAVGATWFYTEQFIGHRSHKESPIDHAWEHIRPVRAYLDSHFVEDADILTKLFMGWIFAVFVIVGRSGRVDLFCPLQKLAFATALRFLSRHSTLLPVPAKLAKFKLPGWWAQQLGKSVSTKVPLIIPYMLVPWTVMWADCINRRAILPSALLGIVVMGQASLLLACEVCNTIDVVNSIYCGLSISFLFNVLQNRYGKALAKHLKDA